MSVLPLLKNKTFSLFHNNTAMFKVCCTSNQHYCSTSLDWSKAFKKWAVSSNSLSSVMLDFLAFFFQFTSEWVGHGWLRAFISKVVRRGGSMALLWMPAEPQGTNSRMARLQHGQSLADNYWSTILFTHMSETVRLSHPHDLLLPIDHLWREIQHAIRFAHLQKEFGLLLWIGETHPASQTAKRMWRSAAELQLLMNNLATTAYTKANLERYFSSWQIVLSYSRMTSWSEILLNSLSIGRVTLLWQLSTK